MIVSASQKPLIAYFSAEWGFSNKLPIYAGGLGILAADILKQARDLRFPWVGIGLFYREGFFRQKLDDRGHQTEEEFKLHPKKAGLEEVLDPETDQPLLIEVGFPKEPAAVQVWQKQIGSTPLFLLDADIPVNKKFEQKYTAHLYEGAWSPFIEQEFLIGVGGIRLLRSLNLPIAKYHINDDHAATSILERLREALFKGEAFENAYAKVKSQTVFTTHTPVAAAVSKYPVDFIWPYLKTLFQQPLAEGRVNKDQLLNLGRAESHEPDQFSFSVLALKLSGKINAVSQRHQQISQKIWSFVFPNQTETTIPIDCVTNAVHPPTWIAPPLDCFYRQYLGKNYQRQIDNPHLWQKLNNKENKDKLNQDLWRARLECKKRLLNFVQNQSPPLPSHLQPSHYPTIQPSYLLLGFARRFAPYKRVYLLISDLERLSKILTHTEHPVYLFVAGKAHPKDAVGKKYLQDIIRAAQDPRLRGHLVFVPDYNFDLAKVLVAGVDLWLNTPLSPMEASGTSGMKAALNGVLNASVSDGWWWEVVERLEAQGPRLEVGWTIGPSNPPLPKTFGKPNPENDQQTATALYDLLESQIVPLYYQQENGLPLKWLQKIKSALTTLAPYFNTTRLLMEYQKKLYQ